MRKQAIYLGFSAALLGLGASQTAGATSMVTLSAEQLVDASELIVRGQVTEVWTERDDKNRIHTRAQVDVDAVLKGAAPNGALVVDTVGGTLGGIYTSVASIPRFSADEDVLLFLERARDGSWRTVGMVQGKYTVRLDPYTRTEIVQQAHVPYDKAYDHRFLPLPAEADRAYLADVEAQVERRVEQGWDGVPIPGVSSEHLRAISPVRVEVK